jgi:hypothetical protein
LSTLAVAHVVGASAAGAAVHVGDADERSITFDFSGQPITCIVRGSSSYGYMPEHTPPSFVTASTSLALDSDDECETALLVLTAAATYRRADDTPQSVSSQSQGGGTTTTAQATLEDPPVVEVDATHVALFRCDDDRFGCTLEFTTSPK